MLRPEPSDDRESIALRGEGLGFDVRDESRQQDLGIDDETGRSRSKMEVTSGHRAVRRN